MDDSIICRFCKLIYDQPKILPCGESICSACSSPSAAAKVTCIYCNQVHDIPSNGFMINKSLEKMMSLHSKIYIEYNDIKVELEKLKYTFTYGKDEASNHFAQLINKIDLETEIKIKQIHDIRDDLIKKVKQYEEACCKSIEINRGAHFGAAAKALIERAELTVTDRSLFSMLNLQKIQDLKSDMAKQRHQISEKNLNGKLVEFNENKNVSNSLIGTLTCQENQTVSMHTNTVYFITQHLKHRPILNSSFHLDIMQSGTIVIGYIASVSNADKLIIETHNFRKKSALHFMEYTVASGVYSYLIGTRDNSIILVENSSCHIGRYEKNLRKTVDTKLSFKVHKMTCSESSIALLELNQECKYNIHILDSLLTPMLKIETKSHIFSFIGDIDYFATQAEYIVIRTQSTSLIVLNRQGCLKTKISLPGSSEIISVDATISVLNRKDKCILNYDYDGNVVKKVTLQSFCDEQIKIDKNSGKFVFVNKSRWLIYK